MLLRKPLSVITPCFLSIAALSNSTANPLFPGADPHAMRAEEKWWIYPTGGPHSTFSAWFSTDLQNWKQTKPILDLKSIPWLVDLSRKHLGAWAPAIIEKDGRYFFYYSVGPQSPGWPSIIGVATSDRPDGPFKDSGKPLLIGGDQFEAIDPMVFKDPKTGVHWFYAGGSDGSKLRIFEMNEDLVSFKREVSTNQPNQFTEGSFVHEKDGIYYLSYSHGRYNSKNYSVHYATSESPIGPWKYRGCILEADATRQGPGHHSFIDGPDGLLIVYHRWDTADSSYPLKGGRKIAIEPVRYDENGLMLPIKMTDN